MEPDVQNLLTNTPCTSSEDDDLNLSECRVLLLGFEASELRKLVNMVRQGGGSRYMSVREKLTHVLVGIPSKKEIKEIRSLAAFGVVSIVKASWLEECTIKKKEVPVFQGHIAYDLPYSQIL
ncbi:DNA topoisomerase 2-binding protein 1-like [Salvia splendens]|nr:DNA topoisomerase 2-binding protein 1-like [Salvia splendens]